MTMSSAIDFNDIQADSWLNCENNGKTITLSKDDGWVIFNLQLAGKSREPLLTKRVTFKI